MAVSTRSQQGSSVNTSSQSLARPPPPPPPRRPRPEEADDYELVDPPPQLRDIPEHIIDTSMAHGVESLQQHRQQQEQQHRVDTVIHTPTISIRMHTPHLFFLRYLHKHDHGGDVVRILVTPHLTTEDLGHCIAQVLPPPLLERLHLPLMGLFQESTGIFVPLAHLLHHATEYETTIFDLPFQRPPPAPLTNNNTPSSSNLKPTKRPWWYEWDILAVAAFAIFAVTLYFFKDPLEYVERMQERVVWVMEQLVRMFQSVLTAVVDTPLKRLYRDGPSILGGWEGMELAQICARITYHGDEAFWRRNLDECFRIFESKQASVLSFQTPLLQLFLVYLLVIAIRSILRAHALRYKWRPDREMMELYQGYNLIIKSIKRSFASESRR